MSFDELGVSRTMKNAPALLLILVALVVYYGYDQRRQGRAEGRSEALWKSTDRLIHTVAKADTIYRTTLRNFRTVDSLYDSVRVTDTLAVVRHDTTVIFVPRATADTVIAMCRLTLRACDARVAASESLSVALRSQLQAIRAAQPSRVARVAHNALWMAAGAGVMAVVKR